MATTDADGATIGIYQPDFSGNYRTVVGARPDTIGITGKPYYPELGLYYYGARWYDPQRGRWMSEEPLGLDGPNMYQFAFNNSSKYFDRFGFAAGDANWGAGDTAGNMGIHPILGLIFAYYHEYSAFENNFLAEVPYFNYYTIYIHHIQQWPFEKYDEYFCLTGTPDSVREKWFGTQKSWS